MRKFNYIVIGFEFYDVYSYVYYELNNLDYAYYDPEFLSTRLFYKVLRRIHWSNYCKIPWKSIWIKKSLRKYEQIGNYFREQRPLCFLISGGYAKLERFGLSACIREMFPEAKIVWHFCDLIAKDKYKGILLKKRDKSISMIYTFDYNDKERYGIRFHNVPYSLIGHLFSTKNFQYDVCFIGQAKDRLCDIINVYKVLKKKGLKCYFRVTGVKKIDQVYKEDIIYSSFIPYSEYLHIISKARSILELLQNGESGNTLRVSEAIAFDKLLLTNNHALIYNPLYEKENMFIFNDPNEISASIVKDNYRVEYKNKTKMLPSQFFKDIEEDMDTL